MPRQFRIVHIVVNGVRAASRRDGRFRVLPDARDLLQDRPDPWPGPETEAVQHEFEQALLHRVDQLPQKQREVLILRYYLDMDERTMSNVLGIPSGFVQIVEWDATSSPLKTLSRSAVPHLHAGRPEALLVVTKGRTTIAIDTDLGSSTIRKVAGSLQPILGNTARQLTR